MKKFKYPLIYPRIYNSDKAKGIKVIKSGQITMSKITKEFERLEAERIKEETETKKDIEWKDPK